MVSLWVLVVRLTFTVLIIVKRFTSEIQHAKQTSPSFFFFSFFFFFFFFFCQKSGNPLFPFFGATSHVSDI